MAVAILVTQELKDKNVSFFANNTVDTIVIKTIPDTFNGAENINGGGYRGRLDLQALDGWKEVVRPSFNTQTQRLGGLILDAVNDVYTYEVIDLTAEEIKSNKESIAESEKQEFIALKVNEQVETELQTIVDDAEAIANQSGYPLWSSFPLGYNFEADFKLQSFDDNLELKLYRIIIPHDKQLANEPNLAPNLWTKIEFSDGGIELWSQPTGGDGKYPYLDPNTGLPYQVEFNGQIWENTFTTGLNVWQPGIFGWTLVA